MRVIVYSQREGLVSYDEIVLVLLFFGLCEINVGPLRHRHGWTHGPVELMTVLMSDNGIQA